jgi:predicted site-specific integrase-resolvase
MKWPDDLETWIEKVGSVGGAVRLLGVDSPTLYRWRSQGVIPTKTGPAKIAAAMGIPENEVTAALKTASGAAIGTARTRLEEHDNRIDTLEARIAVVERTTTGHTTILERIAKALATLGVSLKLPKAQQDHPDTRPQTPRTPPPRK